MFCLIVREYTLLHTIFASNKMFFFKIQNIIANFCIILPQFLSFICPFVGNLWRDYPANNHFFKVKNRNIRKRCEICSKLTIKTPDRHQQWPGVFIAALNIFHTYSSVSIAVFEQAIVSWIVSRSQSSF